VLQHLLFYFEGEAVSQVLMCIALEFQLVQYLLLQMNYRQKTSQTLRYEQQKPHLAEK